MRRGPGVSIALSAILSAPLHHCASRIIDGDLCQNFLGSC